MNLKYPIYIPSYQRYKQGRRLTIRELEKREISYNVIVEPEEESEYRSVVDLSLANVLVLPDEYKENYTTYIDSDAPLGSGPARNFGLEHARENGHDWYWCVDDNINNFYRFHNNEIIQVMDESPFAAVEDFVNQYQNIAMAGMNYESFMPRRNKRPPITFNTRIYSCNLIQTDIGFEWQGRYNEDTDLSLRMLKDGWATVLFNCFLADKEATQRSGGGNTDTVYADKSEYDEAGTYEKTKMLKQQHPTVTQIVRKWDRWHHTVDYSPFEGNDPERKANPPEPRDYNLELKQYD